MKKYNVHRWMRAVRIEKKFKEDRIIARAICACTFDLISKIVPFSKHLIFKKFLFTVYNMEVIKC